MTLDNIVNFCGAILVFMGALATFGIIIAAGLLMDTVRQINKQKEK